MNELDRALNFTLQGEPAEHALADFHRQTAAWGIALPPVKPLVLDFGLGDFRRTGLIEYWIANEAEAGYCGKYLFVFDGQKCPLHRHRRKHETFFVVKGRLAVECDGRRFDLKEGEVLPVAPGMLHSFAGAGPALMLELSMPCEVDDNYFDDTRIPIGGNFSGRKQA
jgi:mannose-6-phosphate isomerase-like protein (cupin superfamily)